MMYTLILKSTHRHFSNSLVFEKNDSRIRLDNAEGNMTIDVSEIAMILIHDRSHKLVSTIVFH